MAPQKHHRYIFWQNIVSPHQVVLLEARAHCGEVDAVLVADTAMSGDRTAPVLHDVTTIVDPTGRDVRDLVRVDGSEGLTRRKFL